MNWINEPNKWYDSLNEHIRFFGMIGIYLACQLLGFLIQESIGSKETWHLIGMFFFAIIGLYRIQYFLVTDIKEFRLRGLG